MITFHDVEQGTEAWLKLREGMITASKFSDVMGKGVGRNNYMMSLVTERLTGLPTAYYTNSAMEWGTETEPQARAHYELMHDVDVMQTGFVTNDKYPGVGISPDGMIGDEGLIEIKCPNSSTHFDYILKGKLHAKYKAQVQGQLWITERMWCDFVSFDPRFIEPGLQMFVVRVVRDEAYIATLESAVSAFKKELDQILIKLGVMQ